MVSDGLYEYSYETYDLPCAQLSVSNLELTSLN